MLAAARTLLRVGSCRFAALYWLACAIGLFAGGRATAGWLAFTFGFWVVHCLATELLNRVADRREDEINRPERTVMCDDIGLERLRVAITIFYGITVAWAGVWIALAPRLLLGALLTVDVLLSVAYSRGPRLKRRKWCSCSRDRRCTAPSGSATRFARSC